MWVQPAAPKKNSKFEFSRLNPNFFACRIGLAELKKMKQSVFLDKFRINSGVLRAAALGLKPLRLLRAQNLLAGWQFCNGLQLWQAGFWLHQCVVRISLAGSKKWFLCPGSVLYPTRQNVGVFVRITRVANCLILCAAKIAQNVSGSKHVVLSWKLHILTELGKCPPKQGLGVSL